MCLRSSLLHRPSAREGILIDDAVPYLSVYLGHDSLDETSKYLKVSSELFPEEVEAFGNFMEGILDKICFGLLDSQLLMEFLDWLEPERGCGIVTRNQRLSALASFADYA